MNESDSKANIKLGSLINYIYDAQIEIVIMCEGCDKPSGYFPPNSPLLKPFLNRKIKELEIVSKDKIKLSIGDEEEVDYVVCIERTDYNRDEVIEEIDRHYRDRDTAEARASFIRYNIADFEEPGPSISNVYVKEVEE